MHVGPEKPTRRPIAVWLITPIVVGLLIWFVIWTSYPSQSRCQNRMRQIAMALVSYHERHGSFPPAYVLGNDGKPWHSWRVLILPELGSSSLFNEYHFDEPWDGPRNKALISKMPDVFACPAAYVSQPGITNYAAVVGSATIWPEQYSISRDDIRDGTNQTVLIVESCDGDIIWTSPDDVAYSTAIQGIGVGPPPTISSTHPHGASIATADGKVNFVSSTIYHGILRNALTCRGGMPFPGLVPQSNELRENLVEIVPAELLSDTFVSGTDDVPIIVGRNVVHCVTLQLAWDELCRSVIGAPLQLVEEPDLCQKLNSSRVPADVLSASSYIVGGGRADEPFLERIREQFAQKFPGKSATIDLLTDPNGMRAYAYMSKNVPFAVPFRRLMEPLAFPTRDGRRDVNAFGLSKSDQGEATDWIRSQVTVLDYSSPSDYILRLSATDSIILAQVGPEPTLGETIRAVQRRMNHPLGAALNRKFENHDILEIPIMTLGVNRSFDELKDKYLANPGFTSWFIKDVRQIIKFRMDERGAVLESESDTNLMLNGHTIPPPRSFIFDRPFLLMLMEPGASSAYFSMWVENAELMEPWLATPP